MTGYCKRCKLFTFIEGESKLCVNCTNYSGVVFTSTITEGPNFFSSAKQLELESLEFLEEN